MSLALSSEEISALRAKTGRECGTCSLCCKVMKIDDPELTKRSDVWCGHCRPGRGGCSIYEARPMICRVWACQWLMVGEIADYWRPTQSRMVLCKEVGSPFTVIVDHSFPDAWRRQPYYDDMKRWAYSDATFGRPPEGLRVKVRDQSWEILPNKDVLLRPNTVCVVSVKVGEDRWELIEFDDVEKAKAFLAAGNAVAEWARTIIPRGETRSFA